MILIRQRVVQEYSELNMKLGRLKSFIGTAPFLGLSVEHQALLQKQAEVMGQYLQLLNRRLIVME